MEKYDETLLGILKENGQLLPFLDTVFGFLYRCTDFYHVQTDVSDRIGFPEGAALKILQHVYHKWEKRARPDSIATTRNVDVEKNEKSKEDTRPKDSAVKETKKCENPESTEKDQKDVSPAVKDDSKRVCSQVSDCYNGAVRDGYRWSQSISDLEVYVSVDPHILKAKDVKVYISSTRLSVSSCSSGGDWTTLVDDDLCWKTNKEESMWTLIPGEEVHIHLEKVEQRWWDALLASEPKIDMSKLDASMPFNDLSEPEQMKLNELMWNQERKRQGLKTTDEIAQENLLKKCWDVEGSPFKGQPFDPSIVKFQGNTSDLFNSQ